MKEETKTDTTFIKITNKDIYSEIINIKNALEHFKEINQEQHTAIKNQVMITNGKVKMNRLQILGLWSSISAIVAGIVWMANIVL